MSALRNRWREARATSVSIHICRQAPDRPGTKAYKAYVAASGHSAYATTPYSRVRSLYIICGSRLNAPSQKAAEDLAMKSCKATRSYYKVTTGGGCEIAASK
ncbi:hypothetical protein [Mesorhizobium sp. BHbdii]